MRRTCGTLAALVLAMLLSACARGEADTAPAPRVQPRSVKPAGPTDVTTWHGDAMRSGADLTESVLTPATVNVDGFGRLRTLKVDGKVDAQPLYLSGYRIGDRVHNVVFVATEHDTVYAFDADTGAALWTRSVLAPGDTTVSVSDVFGCHQVTPVLGITATPVIDRARGVIDLVAMSKDADGGFHQRLHALKLADGSEAAHSPVDIEGRYPGHGAGSREGVLRFDPRHYEERSALLLDHGHLYLSWTSHCDHGPYTGWVMAYDAATLAQRAVIDTTPDGSGGAYWNAGSGPSADAAGNVYLMSGNGSFDTALDPRGFPAHGDYGNAIVKLMLTDHAFSVADYFSMHDSVDESRRDADLGSGGLMLLPALTDAHGKSYRLAVGAGKDHRLYLVDRDDMGHFHADADPIHQEIEGALDGRVFSSPAYFDGRLYYAAVGDRLKAFAFDHARLLPKPVSQTRASFDYPGATPTVSANGDSGGIVWVVQNADGAAVLRAYDAKDLSQQLWNSEQAPDHRDAVGSDNKFMVPTVADGRVFVGTTDSVVEYGLIGPSPQPQGRSH